MANVYGLRTMNGKRYYFRSAAKLEKRVICIPDARTFFPIVLHPVYIWTLFLQLCCRSGNNTFFCSLCAVPYIFCRYYRPNSLLEIIEYCCSSYCQPVWPSGLSEIAHLVLKLILSIVRQPVKDGSRSPEIPSENNRPWPFIILRPAYPPDAPSQSSGNNRLCCSSAIKR